MVPNVVPVYWCWLFKAEGLFSEQMRNAARTVVVVVVFVKAAGFLLAQGVSRSFM